MSGRERRDPPRFLVDAAALRGGRVRLTGEELRHLRVRRLRAGGRVTLFDAQGAEYAGVIARMDAGAAVVEVSPAAHPRRESPVHLILAQAVLKGSHLDLVVEKATELGAAEIVVFTSERSVSRPPASRRERWRRIATSAAKQSGRVRLPEIAGPLDLDAVLERLRHDGIASILFDPGAPPLRAEAAAANRLALLVGPEGGFTTGEVERARAAACQVAGLGPRTLRGETAAVVATALAQFLWGDLGARLA